MLIELAELIEERALRLPEYAPPGSALEQMRLGAFVIRFAPTAPAALAVAEKLRAGAARRKPFPASRKAPKRTAYYCVGGPFAGAQIVVTEMGQATGTGIFTAAGQTGMYRLNSNQLLWQEVA